MRDKLLPALHEVQERDGWIGPDALGEVARRLNVPIADAYGVATFYGLFSTTPRPKTVVHVCDDIACMCNDSAALLDAMQQQYGEDACVRSACLGQCDRAPAALRTDAGESPAMETIAAAGGAIGGTDVRLLARIGAEGSAFAALKRAREIGAAQILEEVRRSKLVGRGGAAFPAARKMEAVAAAAATPRYLICNADESEPGTFKDRVLMEGDPFAVIEGIAIAALAIGSEHAYVYVRGEYPLAAARLQHAIDAAREAGMLDALHIEIRRGAGAYICGEETALFNSIEGKRGEPRNKPPFPAQAGLFGKPTLVNNVETLACLPHIVLHGGDAFAATGTAQSTGTKLFCVSGCVTRPGTYEVPFGATLRELITLAGGLREGAALRCVLLGGAAGTFVGPERLDLPLTFEDTRAIGASIGSGVVMAFDESVDMRAIVARIARFFHEESCGQCVPCRIGTKYQEEALARGETDRLHDIARVMRDASICGLGQTAANAVESALALGLIGEAP